jgi:anti-sigma factor RsiW
MDTRNQNLCERLDAFLDGELSDADAPRFEVHASQCDECRDAAAQQRWLDAALRSDEIAGRTAPARMLAETANAIRFARRKQRLRRMLAGGLAAAASVALVAAWQLREPHAAPGSAGGSVTMPVDVVQRDATPWRSRRLEEASHARGEEIATATKSVATFTAGGSGIAIPVASESPDVTIVQFYSTTEADRRLQRQRELEAKYRELIGG